MAESMVRKQVYITRDQEERLRSMAARRAVSEASLIREAMERMLADAEMSEARRQASWERELEFLQKVSERAEHLRKQGVVSEGRDWRRDDLYDRPKRYYAQ